MKKFLIASLAMTAMAASAHAGSLSLDMRADYNSTTYKDTPTGKDSTKFYFKTGRLDYQGKATEDLSFRARLAFNKDGASKDPDKTQTAVEYAFLTHKMSDMFSLSAGKFNTEFGGFEGATSGADLYLTSQFYNTTGKSATLLGTANLLYMTGVKGTISYEGQQFHLLATNEPDTKAGDVATQNSSMYGAVWRGAFMEKALNFNVSYHTLAGATKDDKHQFTAVGVMWNSSPMMVSVDYLMGEHKTDATGFKDSMNSIVGKIAYTGFEQWTPRLEVVSSEEKIGGTTDLTNKYMGYGVVAEYKPIKDTNFRYHVAYNNITSDLDGVTDKAIKDEVVVGARLMADFLK
ncbi:porin [Bdellovibrio sp.]|uniref:porin n=1 Tax=Bdellovibrio sp. TaxID=28201 RepID=UPI0039E56300